MFIAGGSDKILAAHAAEVRRGVQRKPTRPEAEWRPGGTPLALRASLRTSTRAKTRQDEGKKAPFRRVSHELGTRSSLDDSVPSCVLHTEAEAFLFRSPPVTLTVILAYKMQAVNPGDELIIGQQQFPF